MGFLPSAKAALVGLVFAASAYVYGLHHGKRIERGEQAEQQAIVEAVKNAAIQSAAEAIAGIRVENTTIRQELEREIRTVVDYSQCRNSPDGLRALNDALRAEPAGDGKLPDAEPPD